MRMPKILGRYLAVTYLFNMLFLLLILFAIIYLFDTVELVRRASKRDDIPMSLVFQMGLLKLPEVGQLLFPFAILFSAMFTFWQLTKRLELIVVRATGLSFWQFIAPVILVAVAAGLVQMMIINPIGSLFLSKFQQLEQEYLNRHESQVAFFKEGFWLRQESDDGYVILNAGQVEQPQWLLKNVMVLFFDNDDQFLERFHVKQAELEQGRWHFEDVAAYYAQNKSSYYEEFNLPTDLTIEDVEESFSSPETMSFWRLPSHIEVLEAAGFDASRLRVHYHSLLAQPLLFAAMVLLAASVSMRPARFRGGMRLLSVGVFIGFVIFFLSSFLQALGSSGQIPVVLAAWAPAVISFLLGLSVMMGLEDG